MTFGTYVEIAVVVLLMLGSFWLGQKAGPYVAMAEADAAKVTAAVKADIAKVEGAVKPAPAPQATPPAAPPAA